MNRQAICPSCGGDCALRLTLKGENVEIDGETAWECCACLALWKESQLPPKSNIE